MRTLFARILLAGALLVALFVALMPLVAESGEPREIRIVARQMSFYIDGAGPGNPVITVEPGERVRLTLINEDAGMDHDFAVPAWSLATPLLHGEARTSLVFDAPRQAGTTEYVCSRHLAMMRGTIEVVAAGGRSTASPR
jgi:plastocyanin